MRPGDDGWESYMDTLNQNAERQRTEDKYAEINRRDAELKEKYGLTQSDFLNSLLMGRRYREYLDAYSDMLEDMNRKYE